MLGCPEVVFDVIGSFKICGLGSRVKQNKMKKINVFKSLDFLAIQETKLSLVFISLIHSLQGNPFCDFSIFLFIENSGGLFSILHNSKGSSLFSFVGLGYLCVYLE